MSFTADGCQSSLSLEYFLTFCYFLWKMVKKSIFANWKIKKKIKKSLILMIQKHLKNSPYTKVFKIQEWLLLNSKEITLTWYCQIFSKKRRLKPCWKHQEYYSQKSRQEVEEKETRCIMKKRSNFFSFVSIIILVSITRSKIKNLW